MRTRLRDMLLSDEGYRQRPYICTSGALTVGIGRNLDAVGISRDEAEYLLKNDIKRCETFLRDRFPWYDKLSEARQDVLISMVFNLGMSGFLKFNAMITALEQGNFWKAADEMLNSLWAKQVKGRAIRLAQMMRSGNYES